MRPEFAAATGGLPALAIRRPWLVVVLNLLVVIAGLAALLGAEVRELPNVDKPVVTVSGSWPGATPEALDTEVTRQVESAVARVPGVATVRGYSDEGRFRVKLEFRPEVDLVNAANDVRDALARVQGSLPAGVERLAVVKADADAEPVMQLTISSDRLSLMELSRFVEEQLEPALIAVPGVADVTIFGARTQVMRVRVDPARLAAHGLSVDDIAAALRSARVDVPAGRLRSLDMDLMVRANASLQRPEELASLRLAEGVRLADVATVGMDASDLASIVRLDGRNVVSLGVVPQAQANVLNISADVRRVVADFNARGDGLRVSVVDDDAVFVRDAIRGVLVSLVLSALIVVAVVGLFLGRWRAALVPAVAIPVALVGTLAAIWLLGFSLNLVTLLALVLACGLVVDDALVVQENIQRQRGQGLGPRAAAVLGTREVFFAVLATTATLAAVFVPISFIPSQVGRLFKEFGLVMAVAVALSSFVALSLVPMIAARLPPDAPPGAGQRALARVGRHSASAYARVLAWVLSHGWAVLLGCLLCAAAAAWLLRDLPRELAPAEDRGVLKIKLEGPDGTGLDFAERQLELGLAALQPLVDEGVLQQIYTVTRVGAAAKSDIIAQLPDWAERGFSQAEAGERARRLLAGLPGVRVSVRAGSRVGGGGGDGKVAMSIAGEEYAAIAAAAYQFADVIQARLPGVRDVRVNWRASQPQLVLRVDRRRAAELGVPMAGLDAALRAMVDGYRVTELAVGDRNLPVMLESIHRGRTDAADLLKVQVRAGDGRLVPLVQFVRIEEGATAATLQRLSQRRVVDMDVMLAAGLPMQPALDELRALAAATLPAPQVLLFREEAAALQQGQDALALTFGMALLVVFLVLVAQFESLTSATVVMVTVPFGLAAAGIAMWLGNISMNIYSQIGLLLVVGVVAKNSILMVEFADQLRDAGRSLREAAQEAATARLRPIMMTMASTVLGALPLMLASGAGAEARTAIGTVIFGGLSLAALFTLFLTPVLYLGLARFAPPRSHQAEQLAQELQAAQSTTAASQATGASGPQSAADPGTTASGGAVSRGI